MKIKFFKQIKVLKETCFGQKSDWDIYFSKKLIGSLYHKEESADGWHIYQIILSDNSRSEEIINDFSEQKFLRFKSVSCKRYSSTGYFGKVFVEDNKMYVPSKFLFVPINSTVERIILRTLAVLRL